MAIIDTTREEREGRRAVLAAAKLPGSRRFEESLKELEGLVDAFRSTLSEAACADLLLVVADYSDPEFDVHLRVTEETLLSLGAGEIPVITVMNKSDQVPTESEPGLQFGRPGEVRGDRVWISAKTGEGIPQLLSEIERKLGAGVIEKNFLIPWQESGAEHRLREKARVESCQYEDDGIRIRARIEQKDLKEFEKYIQ